MSRRGRTPPAAALALALVLAACGGGEDPPPDPLRAALATIAPGHAGASGAGFVDVARLRRSGRTRSMIAEVFALGLGPGGDDVFEQAASLRRALGLDPFQASRAVSVAGSYAFGVRLDDVLTSGVGQRLAEEEVAGGALPAWTMLDLGRERSIPDRLEVEGLGPRAARIAVDPARVVFASFAQARSQLMGGRRSLLDDPVTSLAADCLGDAVAARIVPGRLTLSRDVGADLVAAGILADGRERVCFAGGDDAPLLADARLLEDAFDLDREDPVTRQPLRRALSSADVELLEEDGAAAGRVELTLAPGSDPGFVFRSLNTGALVAYVGHEGLFEARDP